MAKRYLNDRIVKSKSLKAKPGQRLELWDTKLPGFGLRITDKGARSYVLAARYPGSDNPARRLLGGCGELTLKAAREKAQRWIDLIERGIDPQLEAEREALVEQRKAACTFAAVAEDFITEKCAGRRQGFETERIIRKELLPAWGSRPIADIAPADIVILLKPIKARGRFMARATLAAIRQLFGWAVDSHGYGLAASPADRLRPKALIGDLPPRQRMLSDQELIALWRSACRMRYPWGPMLKLLLLTGARHKEIAGARWGEIDLANRVWTVPAERFKSNATHIVPLVGAAVEIIERLPRFKRTDFLFTLSMGKAHSRVSDDIKQKLDRRMTRTLKAMARMRGGDSSGVELKGWTVHDLRRVARTHLAALRVPDSVAEAVIGHGKRGLQRVYDQHSYLPEMREALTLWAARLRDITEAPPPNVVAIGRKAS
jgi:integrase